MKIYRLEYHSIDHGRIVNWERSQHRAAYRKRQIKDEIHRDDWDTITIEAIDIPIDKKALIEWLNLNLSRDNG